MKYLLILFMLFFSANSIAQETKKEQAPTTETKPNEPPPISTNNGISSWNLGFGLGVEQYRTPYIDMVSLQGPNRVVLVDQEYRTRPSAWLTMNWNIRGIKEKNKAKINQLIEKKGVNLDPSDVYEMKWGLFAGVKIIDGNSNSFSSFAIGPQISFETMGGQSVSVGVGWVTHGTKRLPDDIEIGKPLPAHYTSIVYKKSTENSIMMMMSVSF